MNQAGSERIEQARAEGAARCIGRVDGVLAKGRALLLPQSAAQPGTVVAPLTIPLGSGRGSDDVAIGDLNGDGLNDLLVNDGPAVLLRRATAPGTFDPPRAKR